MQKHLPKDEYIYATFMAWNYITLHGITFDCITLHYIALPYLTLPYQHYLTYLSYITCLDVIRLESTRPESCTGPISGRQR